MISKCANSDCSATYRFRTGRLFHLHHKGKKPANTHPIQHFWLCSSCSKSFKIEEHDGHFKVMCIDKSHPTPMKMSTHD